MRAVHCTDATVWLAAQAAFSGCSFVTSLPDLSELPALSLEQWRAWFSQCAQQILDRCPDEGVAIFYQTDIKKNGAWIDKGQLCAEAATRVGASLLWHKLVLRRPAGTITFGRPAYSHLLCFSRGVRADVARSTADVLPDAGEAPWTRGMGRLACLAACQFIRDRTTTRTVIDPFCGLGCVLAAANELGLDAVGVEISRKRARQARSFEFSAMNVPAR